MKKKGIQIFAPCRNAIKHSNPLDKIVRPNNKRRKNKKKLGAGLIDCLSAIVIYAGQEPLRNLGDRLFRCDTKKPKKEKKFLFISVCWMTTSSPTSRSDFFYIFILLLLLPSHRETTASCLLPWYTTPTAPNIQHFRTFFPTPRIDHSFRARNERCVITTFPPFRRRET